MGKKKEDAGMVSFYTVNRGGYILQGCALDVMEAGLLPQWITIFFDMRG